MIRFDHGIVLALAAAIAVPNAATAGNLATAGVVALFDDAGRQLRVGSVVSHGVLRDGMCEFSTPTAITLTVPASSTGARARTHVDKACRLVVTDVGAPPAVPTTSTGARVTETSDAGWAPGTRPKTRRAESSAASAGGLTTDVLAAVGATPGLASKQTQYMGTARQTIYDGTTWVYDDQAIVLYTRDGATGRITGVEPAGKCEANTSYQPLVQNEVRACWGTVSTPGGVSLDLRSGGEFRQQYLALYERDRRDLTERFVQHSTGDHGGTCDPGGELPPGWTPDCVIRRD